MGHALGLGMPALATECAETATLRERVFRAVRQNDGFFGDGCNAGNVTDRIDEGIMICIAAGVGQSERGIRSLGLITPDPYTRVAGRGSRGR